MGHFSKASADLNSIVSPEAAVNYSKMVLTDMQCEWSDCPAILNCWNGQYQHLLHHCECVKGRELGHYACSVEHCMKQCASPTDLQTHVMHMHITQIPLPCIVAGCPNTFSSEAALLAHLTQIHAWCLAAGTSNLTFNPSPPLAPTSHPHPHHCNTILEPLPEYSASTHMVIHRVQKATSLHSHDSTLQSPRVPPPSTVKSHQSFRQASPISQPLPSGGTTSLSGALLETHLNSDASTPSSVPPSETVSDGSHDSDTPIRTNIMDCRELSNVQFFTEYIVQPSPLVAAAAAPEPTNILSRPIPYLSPGIANQPHPPRTMGYDAFLAKFRQLEKAGLLDGSGLWPGTDDEDAEDAEEP
ncbi:hypothetical protein K474DRAFT_1664892 [Panus rudis PR-1116 ss-1]|nr:hypothetical protein K474DRAFT_1664892 [Panus rudis PR-1116 ss-1]